MAIVIFLFALNLKTPEVTEPKITGMGMFNPELAMLIATLLLIIPLLLIDSPNKILGVPNNEVTYLKFRFKKPLNSLFALLEAKTKAPVILCTMVVSEKTSGKVTPKLVFVEALSIQANFLLNVLPPFDDEPPNHAV